MDSILDMMEENSKPFQSHKPKPQKVNLWDNTDIKPMKIDLNKVLAPGNTFTIYVFDGGKEIPEGIYDKFEELAKVLYGKGYTLRFNLDDSDEKLNSLITMDKARVEVYLPWKKFNAAAADLTKGFNKPTECGYRIAKGIKDSGPKKIFDTLPPAVRAMIASNVNTVMGKDCIDPVKFIVGYTPNGAEAYEKGMTYKDLGVFSNIFPIAEAGNVPIFNIKNDESLKKLIDLIKS